MSAPVQRCAASPIGQTASLCCHYDWFNAAQDARLLNVPVLHGLSQAMA